MEPTILQYGPAAIARASIGMGYSGMVEIGSKMGEFVRGLGYKAQVMGNDTSLSVPIVIDAGLGELGRHGLAINPEFGPSFRPVKILTNMPLAVDKPIEFGVAEFCRTCKKCAELCPSKSIPMDKDPSYDVYCYGNNPGMKKWYVNTYTCHKFWNDNGNSCSICTGVCTYVKPRTWAHDFVKGISSRTSIFNSAFATLDDAFGYGKTLASNDPREFWKSPGRNKRWPGWE